MWDLVKPKKLDAKHRKVIWLWSLKWQIFDKEVHLLFSTSIFSKNVFWRVGRRGFVVFQLEFYTKLFYILSFQNKHILFWLGFFFVFWEQMSKKIKVGGASVKTPLKTSNFLVPQLLCTLAQHQTHLRTFRGNLSSEMGPDPTSKQPAPHHTTASIGNLLWLSSRWTPTEFMSGSMGGGGGGGGGGGVYDLN